MVAAKKAEQAQPKKYYNRIPKPQLRAVPVQVEQERIDAQELASARKSRASLVQTAALIFVCMAIGALAVAGYERLTSASLQVDKLKKQIASTQTRIDKLDIQLACAVDIEHVMDVASGDMEMVYPKKDQIVPLDGVTADAPVRLAYVEPEYTEPEYAEPESTAPEQSADTFANEGQTEAPAAPVEESEAGAVPAYAAAAVRVAEEEGQAPSSTNLILSAPQ